MKEGKGASHSCYKGVANLIQLNDETSKRALERRALLETRCSRANRCEN